MSKVNMSLIRRLYTSCTVPSIVFSCEAWHDTNKYEKLLEGIQYKCLRRLFKVPDSTPKPALLMEMQVLHIIQEVHKRQFLYLHKLLKWPKERLAKAIFDQQENYYNYRSTTWSKEIKARLNYYNLGTFKSIKSYSRHQWKGKVKESIQRVSSQKCLTSAAKLSKLKLFSNNIDYPGNALLNLNLKNARTIFQARTRMLPLKNNFKGSHKDDHLECPRCNKEGSLDNEEHLLTECEHTHTEDGKFSPEDIFSKNLDTLNALATTIKRTLNVIV